MPIANNAYLPFDPKGTSDNLPRFVLLPLVAPKGTITASLASCYINLDYFSQSKRSSIVDIIVANGQAIRSIIEPLIATMPLYTTLGGAGNR